MRRITGAKPSPALVIAVIALVAALGGGAVAGVAVTALNKKERKQVKKISKRQGKKQGKKQARQQIGKQFPIGSSQIANGAVGGAQIANSSIGGAKIANSSIGGAKIAANSIDDSKLSDLDVSGESFVRAPVSDQTDKDYDEAQAAAPVVPLLSRGQLSVYGKCFESLAFESFAEVYVRTSAPGAILGANDTVDPEPTPPGGPGPKNAVNPWLDGYPQFLNPGTPEHERTVGRASEGSGSFQQSDLVRASFTAMSPDGTAINGLMSMAVGDGGIFGSGNGCLFSGFAIG